MSASKRKKKWTHKIRETNVRLYLKFNIGSTCWYIYNNNIRKGKIDTISLTVDSETTYSTAGLKFKESKLFQTKQTLINSLYIEFEEYEKVTNETLSK